MKKSLLALAALAAMGESSAAGWSRKGADEPRGHQLRALDAGGLMANVDSSTLNDNNFMQAFGNAVVASGKLSLAANPTAADVLRIMRIPAGTKVEALIVAADDCDSNGTPTFVVSIGYAPVNSNDGPTASAAYFAAAGQTFLETGTSGLVYRKFDAITFEKDVYLTMTVGTAAATFAAGAIYATAIGSARGVK
jgi:hypothetical protein